MNNLNGAGMPVNESLDTDHEDSQIDIFKAIRLLLKNARLLILGAGTAGIVALAGSFLIPPTFTATTRFLPPQQQQSAAAGMLQSLGALGGLASAASGLKNPTDQYVAFLKTRAVQDALVNRHELKTRYEKKFSEDARSALAERTRIASAKDNIIVINTEDRDPQFAANLANSYVEELGKLLNRLAVTEAQQRRVFFESQLSSAKQALIKAEQALGASGVSTATLNASPATAVEATARLRAQVTASEVKLAALRGYLTESAPEVRTLQIELTALQAQLSKAEREQPRSASNNDYIGKFRDFKYAETLFELYARQYEIARVDESREGAAIQVIDIAQPPERRSKPRRIIIAAVVAFGAFALLAAFILIRNRSIFMHPQTNRGSANN